MRASYGMTIKEDPLTFLLALNGKLADLEAAGWIITGPGLPSTVEDPRLFITTDHIARDRCVTVP